MQSHGPNPLPPFGPTPYGSPPTPPPSGPPPVWTWFRVYSGAMAFMYLAFAGMGVFMMLAGPEIAAKSNNPADAAVMPFLGLVYGVLGVVFMAVYAVGLGLPRKPWA